MKKNDLHQHILAHLKEELAAITAAAKSSFDTATNDAHHAESKYDTFSLESSYLARGQAKRVEELNNALERMEMLPLKKLDAKTPIQLSALIKLENEAGETRNLFFGPSAGGEEISVDGQDYLVITSSSPLGAAVLGKKVGDRFQMNLGIDVEKYKVVSVE